MWAARTRTPQLLKSASQSGRRLRSGAEVHTAQASRSLPSSLVLMGVFQSWGKRGVDNVRRQRKAKYATAGIFVPREVWEEGRETFAPFLAINVEAAIRAIVDRAGKARYLIEADLVIRDVARVTLDFARSS